MKKEKNKIIAKNDIYHSDSFSMNLTQNVGGVGGVHHLVQDTKDVVDDFLKAVSNLKVECPKYKQVACIIGY